MGTVVDDHDRIGSRFYCCIRCRNILAYHDDIWDTSYVSGGKRAILFSHGMNMDEGIKEETPLISGNYLASDMFCQDCGHKVGWKYHLAYAEHNKFKEGKIVLIKAKIAKAYDSIFHS